MHLSKNGDALRLGR